MTELAHQELFAIRDAFNNDLVAVLLAVSEDNALERYLDLEQLGKDEDAWYDHPNGHRGMVVTNYEVYAVQATAEAVEKEMI